MKFLETQRLKSNMTQTKPKSDSNKPSVKHYSLMQWIIHIDAVQIQVIICYSFTVKIQVIICYSFMVVQQIVQILRIVRIENVSQLNFSFFLGTATFYFTGGF